MKPEANRGIPPFNLNFICRPLYSREMMPAPTEQDAGCAPELVWTFWRREKSLSSAGI